MRGKHRLLETKYVGDNFEMLVTVLADFVTKILYFLALASVTNIQKMSPTSTCHKHPLVTNIYVAATTAKAFFGCDFIIWALSFFGSKYRVQKLHLTVPSISL